MLAGSRILLCPCPNRKIGVCCSLTVYQFQTALGPAADRHNSTQTRSCTVLLHVLMLGGTLFSEICRIHQSCWYLWLSAGAWQPVAASNGAAVRVDDRLS